MVRRLVCLAALFTAHQQAAAEPLDVVVARLQKQAAESLDEPDAPPLMPLERLDGRTLARAPWDIRRHMGQPLALRVTDYYLAAVANGQRATPTLPPVTGDTVLMGGEVAVDFAPLSKGLAILTFQGELASADGKPLDLKKDAIPLAVEIGSESDPTPCYAGLFTSPTQFFVAVSLTTYCESVVVGIYHPDHSPYRVDWKKAEGKTEPLCIVKVDRPALIKAQGDKLIKEHAQDSADDKAREEAQTKEQAAAASAQAEAESRVHRAARAAKMDMHEWRTTDGRRFEAEFTRFENGVLVVTDADLAPMSLKLSELDKASREQLQAILRERKEKERQKPKR